MSQDHLSNPVFQDADKAREWLEAHLWAEGPVCGYCGTVNEATALSTRPGYYQCNSCRKQFTVMVGTVFERSHVPLNKWLFAAFLLCASKKGVSAHQIHRMIGVTYKTAWFMMHRLREAMNDHGTSGPLGGEGKTIEADETYFGPPAYVLEPEGWRVSRDLSKRMKVVTLVERGGRARSVKVDNMTSAEVRKVLVTNADRKSRLMTDEATMYPKIGKEFASHDTVNHKSKEYARGDVTTNTVEGFFSIFKRGMKGVYQHCSEKHLQRYLYEFDFRYSNRTALGIDDTKRAEKALKGIVGKRLTYRRTNLGAHQQA
jgi:transposase-like protein